MIVSNSEIIDSEYLFSNNVWWHQVRLTPEHNKIIVLSKGISYILKGVIPVGGHIYPISKVEFKLLWKKAQKNEKKNITSEIINKIIPTCNPFITAIECIPW